MRLHDIVHLAHHVTHKHTTWAKDGVGDFKTCTWRLPWVQVDVGFRPDFSEAGWYYVPAVEDEDGTLLITRIIRAENAWDAMAILRAQYAQMTNA
jgi:hypothetical protein